MTHFRAKLESYKLCSSSRGAGYTYILMQATVYCYTYTFVSIQVSTLHSEMPFLFTTAKQSSSLSYRSFPVRSNQSGQSPLAISLSLSQQEDISTHKTSCFLDVFFLLFFTSPGENSLRLLCEKIPEDQRSGLNQLINNHATKTLLFTQNE